MIKVIYDRGIYLPDLDLWLDPPIRKATAFVSHAHSDHIGNHQEVLLTNSTAQFMAMRLRGKRIEHAIPFRVPFEFRGATLTLLPAGHIFGSAQLHVRLGSDSLLYTGDFKLRKGLSAEPTEWLQADTLIMETTFGVPKYVFPPTEQVVRQLVKFCIESLEDGNTPVLLGYSLGKAQEILESLRDSGLRTLLHPAVFEMTSLYQKLNGSVKRFSLYNEADLPGSVVICPPNTSSFIQQIRNRRTAMFTGWAHDPSAVYRYQCDAVFPLSDHADYPDLIRYVELVQPLQILSIHGFAHEFAADLRRRGYNAWSLVENNQLELDLTSGPATKPGPASSLMEAALNGLSSEPIQPGQPGFALFARICRTIRETTGKANKIKVISNYLASLTTDQIPIAVSFLMECPPGEGANGPIASLILKRAIIKASKLTEAEFRALHATYAGDLSSVILDPLIGNDQNVAFSIAELADEIGKVKKAVGPSSKIGRLAELLAKLNSESASCVVQILTSTLHLGVKNEALQEIVANLFHQGEKAAFPFEMLNTSPSIAAPVDKKDAICEQMAFNF
jgi:Cft2 family RNA processing exonuclease